MTTCSARHGLARRAGARLRRASERFKVVSSLGTRLVQSSLVPRPLSLRGSRSDSSLLRGDECFSTDNLLTSTNNCSVYYAHSLVPRHPDLFNVHEKRGGAKITN